MPPLLSTHVGTAARRRLITTGVITHAAADRDRGAITM